MSKTWGKIGAWAAEAEQADAEEAAAAAAAAAAAPPQSYPSLKEAVNTNKGKKKTKMTLQEFTMAGTGTGIGSAARGLTPEEMMRLPTGPKERSAEEMQYGRSGGGFSSYGTGRNAGRPGSDGDGAWGNNRRSYSGFEDRGTGPRVSRVPEYDQQQPSRADEVDNWKMMKKTTSFDVNPRPNRLGQFSRADELDNWTVNKKPSVMPNTRSNTFGQGFRDSGGPEMDRWTRGMQVGSAPRDSEPTERRRLVLDPPKGESESLTGEIGVKSNNSNKPNPFGNARPREEILAEKGLDWKKVDLEIEAKKVSSRPTSSHSNSRPGSAQSGRSGEGFGAELQGVEKPKPKVNPFGDAKPREVLLQEKGVDYRKIDLDLERRRLNRSETEAEKNLKEEIENLKRECEKESVFNAEKGYNGNQSSLHNKILQLEGELEQLSRDLDDKLRFTQKPIERPGSGAGRVGPGFQERPGSGAGRVGPGFQDRPGSGAGRMGSGFHDRPGSGAGRVGMGFPERPGSGAGRVNSGFQERPGSGAGRVSFGYQDRPPSQSSSFDESRSVDFSERHWSRGDPWMRSGPPGDDRRGFGGGRDRGFLGNRELGRSNSRERW
uniref:eukaryotic translation initiation factor 4B2-like n=1 Tax=Erigeron canadensis TaxID=72917 RepID=UPI001CB8BC0E|nr:eukaryotic translation initiation factor 4B2-like [Erigeron canadensis]